MISIVADVGGTNTRVGLADGAALREGSVDRFRNAEFASLPDVLRRYIAARGVTGLDGACVAMAGPVTNGVAELTNLDWRIDGAMLSDATGARDVAVLNDLQAQGYGIAHIAEDRLRRLARGQPDSSGVRVVVGVGTGFNIAPVHPVAGQRLISAAEAGHVTLPVLTAEDLSLSQFVAEAHGFADVEEVLSGRGVEGTYRWVTARAGAAAAKSAREIFEAFEAGTDPHARTTLRTIARMLGIVTGDIALMHLPSGGIYFSGGVARALGPHLRALGFFEGFGSKGRFSELMRSFPITIIEDDYAALSGAAEYLMQQAR